MISFRERNPLVLGLLAILGIAMGLALAFNLNRLPFIAGSYAIKAEFADAAGIRSQDEVRVAGVKVGKVKEVALSSARVLVTMDIDREVKIPRQATAEIVLRTILGSKFVAIDARAPGAAMREGDTIPIDRTRIPFEIYQTANSTVDLLSGIDGDALNAAFRALANAAEDPNRRLAGALSGTAKVAGAVGAQSDSLSTLIAQGEALLVTLDDSSPEIQALLREGNTVLELLSRRRATVQTLLRQTDLLAGSLGGLIRDNRTSIDSLLRDLHAVLVVVDQNLGDLEEALRVLGPSTESFARIFTGGRWGNICVYSIERLGAGGTGGPPVDCAESAPNFVPASRRTR